VEAQLSLFEIARWTVSGLTRYLSQRLAEDPLLQDVWVEGEISNLSRPTSGHLYFTLKDDATQLRCVMWRSEAARLRLALSDGMAVTAHGYISIYEAGGLYQLYVDSLRPAGEGALFQEFLHLKERLAAEGLFDTARKRPIPSRARRIGVITSPTGAALRDILHVLRRRNPLAEVVFASAPVQGEDAPPRLVEALERLNRIARPDVILLARGGGSLEDLWAFNDERLVRAIVASTAPVISGVGHETDFTLADFAADLRAPTPTAAAELATPITLEDLRAVWQNQQERLRAGLQTALVNRRQALRQLQTRLEFSSPARRIQSERQRLDEWARRLIAAPLQRLHLTRTRLRGLEDHLHALNPWAVVQRGYAIVTRQTDGQIITSRQSVQRGEALQVRVRDGAFGVAVTDISP
jgi:exodeoxyribonuclease VII large subunit